MSLNKRDDTVRLQSNISHTHIIFNIFYNQNEYIINLTSNLTQDAAEFRNKRHRYTLFYILNLELKLIL